IPPVFGRVEVPSWEPAARVTAWRYERESATGARAAQDLGSIMVWAQQMSVDLSTLSGPRATAVGSRRLTPSAGLGNPKSRRAGNDARRKGSFFGSLALRAYCAWTGGDPRRVAR